MPAYDGVTTLTYAEPLLRFSASLLWHMTVSRPNASS